MQQLTSRQWTHQHGKVLLAVALDPEMVGERIAEAREARGWTQLDFALEAGVSPSSVQRWEAGKLPPVRRLLRLAELLEVEAEVLIEPRGAVERDDQLVRLLKEEREQAEVGRRALARSLKAIHDDLRRIEARLPQEVQPSREVRP
jgi:transcriptional regulator with XRE-family HTH domain